MLLKRSAEEKVIIALKDTRIVAIQGARQTGKTTLARTIASKCNGEYITLDDKSQREAASIDPRTFVRQFPGQLLIIDEIQRVPELILAIKEVVDADTSPGQFLLTGSSDLTKSVGIEDSLAGRIELIDLYGLSMLERHQGAGIFLEALAAEKPMDILTRQNYSLTRQDYLALALEGGYPEALTRSDKTRRDIWFDNYIKQLLSKDTGEVNRLRRIGILPKLFKYLASISGKPAVLANIANDIQEPRSTIEEYINFLGLVFLIDKVPAWSSNITTRAIKHTKLMYRDSGLLCHQLNATDDMLTNLTSNIAGAAFEAFVYGELKKLAVANKEEPSIYHYRDAQKREVDFVVQFKNGRLCLLEIKLSSSVGIADFKAMENLRIKHNSQFNCFVIYTGEKAIAFGDHLFAVPAQALWS